VIRAVRALPGGTHALTWLIQTANPEREVVLREYPAGDDAACHETRVLTALDGLGGLAPLLLASDVSPAAAEGSWVMISRLPGLADIAPSQPVEWARQLGQGLARIHATPLQHLSGFPMTHYDFWSGNTVWDHGVLTGVVDWSGASLGPAGFDTGWCRLDLYLLCGEHVADQFLDAYQAASGAALPDPLLCELGPELS
jgi:aminoglycoside phosphotransferase (APT) family kinase protein